MSILGFSLYSKDKQTLDTINSYSNKSVSTVIQSARTKTDSTQKLVIHAGTGSTVDGISMDTVTSIDVSAVQSVKMAQTVKGSLDNALTQAGGASKGLISTTGVSISDITQKIKNEITIETVQTYMQTLAGNIQSVQSLEIDADPNTTVSDIQMKQVTEAIQKAGQNILSQSYTYNDWSSKVTQQSNTMTLLFIIVLLGVVIYAYVYYQKQQKQMIYGMSGYSEQPRAESSYQQTYRDTRYIEQPIQRPVEQPIQPPVEQPIQQLTEEQPMPVMKPAVMVSSGPTPKIEYGKA